MVSSEPSVTIVIPIKPGLCPEALAAIKELEYPKEKIEIITVYGRNPSKQRNEAVKLAQGDVIYFLDNDSLPAKDTLKRLVSHLDENVVLSGGPSLMPEKLNILPFLFGKTLESFFSTGTSYARYKKVGEIRLTTEKEIILCNMVMWKKAFIEAGGLNEKLYPNEENELMEKLKHSGKKMIYDPNAYIIRMPRKTLKGFIKQIFSYGRGRGEQTYFYPKSFNLANFLPLFFLIYIIFASFIRGIMLLPLGFYMFILFVDAIYKYIREKKIAYLLLPFSTFLLHLTYGFGLIFGILRAPFKKNKEGELKIEFIEI